MKVYDMDQSMSIEKDDDAINNAASMKSTKNDFVDADRIPSTGLFSVAECALECFVGCLPIVGKLVRHSPPQLPRPYYPHIYIKKPGMFSLRTIFDAVTFRWIKYLSEDDETDESAAETLISTYQSTQQNVALVSALLLTVWATFFTELVSNFDETKDIVAYYMALILFTFASFNSMFGTILPVFLCMTTSEIGSKVEALYYLRFLDRVTFGVGSHGGLVFLYGSCCGAYLGMFPYVYYFSTFGGACAIFVTMNVSIGGFVLFYNQIVSCVYSSIKSSVRVQNRSKTTSLTFGELNQCLLDYMKSEGAEKADDLNAECTADDFIFFIENQYSKEPITLPLITVNRAKRLFDTYLERNLFDKVRVHNFKLQSRDEFLELTK